MCSRCRSASASADGGAGEPADARAELRESRARSTVEAPRASRAAAGAAGPDELVERGRERGVRRADDGVAVAVEHGRTLAGELARELPDEPALPGAGLARDERRATSLADRPRQQRAQLGELAGSAGECVRGREPKRARERSRLGHDQI